MTHALISEWRRLREAAERASDAESAALEAAWPCRQACAQPYLATSCRARSSGIRPVRAASGRKWNR